MNRYSGRLILLIAVLALAGCGAAESITAPVNAAAPETQLNAVRQTADTSTTSVVSNGELERRSRYAICAD